MAYTNPAVQLRLKIIERGSKSNPLMTIKALEQEFSSDYTQRDLAKVKNEVLNIAETTINIKRKRDIEEHMSAGTFGAKEGWRWTFKNNLINVLKEGTVIEELDNNRYTLGIGHKKFLNTYARYWYVVNYGKTKAGSPYIPPSTVGYFERGEPPKKGGGSQAFHYTATTKGMNPYTSNGRAFLMEPKKAISPMNYLEEMAIVFEVEVALLEKDYATRIDNAIQGKTTVTKKLTEKQKWIADLTPEERGKLFGEFKINPDVITIAGMLRLLGKPY